MFKTITKARNRKAIIVYYSLAVIFISIGIFTGRSTWYVVGAVALGSALFRKYWLMKKLKD